MITRRDFLKGLAYSGLFLLNNSITQSKSLEDIIGQHNNSGISCTPTGECRKNSFNIGYILLTDDPRFIKNNFPKAFCDPRFDYEELDKITKIKNNFPKAFYYATNRLATADVKDPVYIMQANQDMIFTANGQVISLHIIPTITKEFYKDNEDVYDFLGIYSTFLPLDSTLFHISIKQSIYGIGLSLYDDSITYGSKGFLKGIGYLGSTQGWDYKNKGHRAAILNQQLHEIIGHQYCTFINEIRSADHVHTYPGLQCPDDYKVGSVMGARKWLYNGNKIIAEQWDENNPPILKFHPIELYLMGLLPESEYDTKYDIFNVGTWPYDYVTYYKDISIRDIINVEGKRIDYSMFPSLSIDW